MKHKILSIGLILVFGGIMSIKCFAQNKLTRNQILDAVRTHQQDIDSVNISIGDSVICDSTTTKITLDVMNDSLAHNYSYRLIFSKKDIEVDVYNDDNNLYRSIFEYTDFTYENLKAKINKYNIRKIDSYNDACGGKENYIFRLYRGNKTYMSIENYNGRTNATAEFHDLIEEIKKLIPDISSVFLTCEEYEVTNDSVVSDTVDVNLILSDESIRFKNKGGEFKKVKVICNIEDWEILSYPNWITISRNDNEFVIESTKNNTKKHRTGILKVGCLGETKEISILQN